MRRSAAVAVWLALGLAWPARSEWRVAAYLGGAASQRSSVAIDQPALGTNLRLRRVEFEGQSFRSPVYYGSRAGYVFGRGFGVEAEFIHAKVFARVQRPVEVDGMLRGAPISGRRPMESIVGRFSISHGLNLLLGNVVYSRGLGRRSRRSPPRVLLTGRFGVGGTIPHAESEVLGAAREQYQGGRPVVQTAGGVELRLWRGLHWVGEYKFTRSAQRVDIAGGTAETLLRSHHGIFGLAYHFRR